MDQSSCSAPVRSAPGGSAGGFAPIAVIGLGCRFPKAPNVGAYWRMMLEGVDAISEVPPDRWDVEMFYDPRPATPCKIVTRNGGFLEGIDRFDPYFFGISPREAVRMDPQQRLLLEVTWEAMEYAGIPRERFVGSHTGVFVGVCTDDYITLERGDFKNIDIYLGTGGSPGSTAGRLAYTYGLSGPSAAIDTACSSSLVAVHQACTALQQGDCDMALAAGVNVVLHPGTAVAFSQANLLSPDGRCKAFDSRANGFVRSEGAGVVLLKPLAAALRDGDPVYAVVRGTASNNDGCSSPFMTPSRTGQAALLRQAYDRAGIAPSGVQYLEAHGTGTPVGDPVEIGAIADVIAPGRSPGDRCVVGSS
jgi:acyl transferase domain-containing protein